MYLAFGGASYHSALNSYNSFTKLYNTSLERLSTGKRINSSADDPSVLSLLSSYKSSLAGANRAAQNASDGITLLETADSALDSIADSLQTIRTNFVAASSGGTEQQLANYQTAINESIGAIDTLVRETEYNGFNLFDGSQDFNIDVGVNSGSNYTLKFQANTGTAYRGIGIDVTKVVGASDQGHLIEGVPTASFSLDQLSTGSTTVAEYDGTNRTTITTSGLASIDQMISNVSRMQSLVGAHEDSLGSILDSLNQQASTFEEARARLEDVDVAAESSRLSEYDTQRQSISLLLADAHTGNKSAVLNLLP